MHRSIAIVCLASLGGATAGCGRPADTPQVQSSYDASTGKLKSLTADLNGDGRIDTWTYMDGAVPLRTEQDMDGDGRIERWEYARPDASTEKVAVSRSGNGRPDMWTHYDTAGQVTKIEIAALRPAGAGQESRIERTEFHEGGRLVRVEEDTDADGKVDKWELHDGPTVTSVDFDEDKDGKPDVRVTFGPGGQVVGRERITVKFW